MKRKVVPYMKKFLSLLLVLCMLVPFAALADEAPAIKLGQVQYAAHGTKCFAVMTVVLQDDVIVAAYIDEFQVGAGMVGVPNSENGFGGFAEHKGEHGAHLIRVQFAGIFAVMFADLREHFDNKLFFRLRQTRRNCHRT